MEIPGQFHQHLTRTFLPIFWRQKITKPKCNYREKLVNLLSNKKRASKMLMKLSLTVFRYVFNWGNCLMTLSHVSRPF